jgi:hypothetical protein
MNAFADVAMAFWGPALFVNEQSSWLLPMCSCGNTQAYVLPEIKLASLAAAVCSPFSFVQT